MVLDDPPTAQPNRPTSPGGRSIALRVFVGAERVVFSLVGAMFFFAAFAVAVRATTDLWGLAFGPRDTIIVAGTAFLDLMLLVLMLVELAYTVITSLRGTDLSAEPFLIVGLIAVIRRILVITIGGVNLGGKGSPEATSTSTALGSQPIELAILTAVVLVFVGSIALLRVRSGRRDDAYGREPLPNADQWP
jgi:uncharacterized membrane protein (DUF373 family)